MIAHKFLNLSRPNAVMSEKINKIWLGKSHTDFLKLTNECMYKLKDARVESRDRVAYCGKNSSEWLAWNLATYMVGATWVPLYDNQPNNYVNSIVNDCEPKLLITDNNFNLTGHRPKIIGTSLKGDESENITVPHSDNDLAALIYTSGTTGAPKGAKISHVNILSNLEAIERTFDGFKSKRSLSVLPWAHIYGLNCELYYNLFNNTTTFINTDKNNFIEECREVKPETLYVVPKILDAIKLKVEGSYLKYLQPYIVKYILGNNIDVVFTGGAKLSKDTLDFYNRNSIVICEGYGCTETSPIISLNGLEDKKRNIKTVGKILDNINVEIINNEICVRGPSIISGYWNQEPFKNNVYKTGDSGYIEEDNFLVINGRISDNYKLSNGKFVNVNNVEEKLKKYIKGNYMIFGKDLDNNHIISDVEINQAKLDRLNELLDPIDKICKSHYIDTDKFGEYMTPKMSIKRSKLESFVKETHKL